MDASWIESGRRALLASFDADGWPYRRGGPTAVEATALAALGLLATDGKRGPDSRPFIERAADRLAALQRPDGSLGPTSAIPSPGWATPFAILLWQALGSHRDARRRARDWLLAERVDHPPRSADPDRISGHDTSIRGWPWVEGTHSWVEPTSLALLALGIGTTEHPRVVEARALLRDRKLAAGGWNYGNTVVFGHALRPQPSPTGLALLALAAAGEERASLESSLKYLRAELPGISAASSLGWGILGLRAWGATPPEADGWLARSARDIARREDAAPRIGLLLLASGNPGLSAFLPDSMD